MNQLRVYFSQRPEGEPGPEVFEIRSEPAPTAADLGEGDVLVAVKVLSLDPYMRGRMMARKSYIPGFALGEVFPVGAVGRVVASSNPRFPVDSHVYGMLGMEEYTLVRGGKGLVAVDPSLAPLSYYLGVMGMPGLTAWVGLLDIGRPQPGEMVYVSAAAGAVGQVVGQIAKLKGCRVVGSAGGEAKVRFLVDELGFDAAWDRHAVSTRDGLKEHCPGGVDVYFDNVGGPTLDAAIARMNDRGRAVICGMISQYSLERPDPVYSLINVLVRRLTIQGFIIFDHQHRMPAFMKEMAGWLQAGDVRYREDVSAGLESAPEAFLRMMRGDKIGKMLVQVAQ